MTSQVTRGHVSVCWSSPRHCDHLLSCVNGAGLPLGQLGTTAMFYCNTCGKEAAHHSMPPPNHPSFKYNNSALLSKLRMKCAYFYLLKKILSSLFYLLLLSTKGRLLLHEMIEMKPSK